MPSSQYPEPTAHDPVPPSKNINHTPMLTKMQPPSGGTVMVNQCDVANRVADGWTIVAQGAL